MDVYRRPVTQLQEAVRFLPGVFVFFHSSSWCSHCPWSWCGRTRRSGRGWPRPGGRAGAQVLWMESNEDRGGRQLYSLDHNVWTVRALETHSRWNWGKVSRSAMLWSAVHYSAFARGEKISKQPPPRNPSLSIFTEIHMAINKTSYGFCARISQRGAPEKIVGK